VKKQYTPFVYLSAAIMILFFAACSKDFGAKPTYRGKTLAGTWAKQEVFYYPTGLYLDTATGNWRSFIGFSFSSEGEPDVLGFYNPYVANGKGTNLLGMKSIYSAQNLSNDSGTYNLQAPKCFKFVPDNPTATVGNVLVLPQDIRCVRVDRSVFIIPIKPTGTPGRYDEPTKTFEVDVMFDESAIGGPATKIRKYKFSTT
jgi:hypothetical protein